MDSLLPLVFHELLMGKEPWSVIHERAESVDAPNRQVAELGKRWTDVAAGQTPGQKFQGKNAPVSPAERKKKRRLLLISNVVEWYCTFRSRK